MRRLLFRPQARLDLLEIWHYIAKKSPGIASSVTDRIERDIRMLLAMPTMGHHRKDVSDHEIRFWSV